MHGREASPAGNDPPADEELVARVAAGDRRAYAELTARHLDRTVALARRVLGSGPEAEDVAQEAFLRLWLHAGRYRPQAARFTTWFHRITMNLCLDLKRRPAPLDLETAGDPEDPGETADLSLERRRRMVALAKAVATLPDRQRAAVALTYDVGLSNAEAAKVLDVGVKAFEALLVRARRTLREKLVAWDGAALELEGAGGRR